MKLIFMGTPEFAVTSLERLIADDHRIEAVFTQPDKPAGRGKHLHTPPVKALALDHGIAVHQPSKIKTNDEVREIFESIAPDACVVVAYGKILPAWMLSIPRLGCINVHASLLPKYRGAAPINWAIAHGERETGVTIMQMDAGMDTGPMLTQRSVEIGMDETAPELSSTLARVGAELLSKTLPRIERGDISPINQDDGEASYAPMLKREDGFIDWQMQSREIANRIRAFQPWPGSYTNSRGGRLIVWRGREVQDDSLGRDAPPNADPGTILGLDQNGIVIKCGGSSALLLDELQIEGKRRVAASEFANGARLKPGDRINQN